MSNLKLKKKVLKQSLTQRFACQRKSASNQQYVRHLYFYFGLAAMLALLEFILLRKGLRHSLSFSLSVKSSTC